MLNGGAGGFHIIVCKKCYSSLHRHAIVNMGHCQRPDVCWHKVCL